MTYSFVYSDLYGRSADYSQTFDFACDTTCNTNALAAGESLTGQTHQDWLLNDEIQRTFLEITYPKDSVTWIYGYNSADIVTDDSVAGISPPLNKHPFEFQMDDDLNNEHIFIPREIN